MRKLLILFSFLATFLAILLVECDAVALGVDGSENPDIMTPPVDLEANEAIARAIIGEGARKPFNALRYEDMLVFDPEDEEEDEESKDPNDPFGFNKPKKEEEKDTSPSD